MNHILHILIEKRLKKWLKSLEMDDIVTLSGKIVFLVRTFLRENGNIPLPFHNQMTRKPPRLKGKKDFNLCLPLSLYRLVKKEQSVYNYFSKGHLIRNILWYFYYLNWKFTPKLAWEYFTGKHNDDVIRVCRKNAHLTHYSRVKNVHMHKRYILTRRTIAFFVHLLE